MFDTSTSVSESDEAPACMMSTICTPPRIRAPSTLFSPTSTYAAARGRRNLPDVCNVAPENEPVSLHSSARRASAKPVPKHMHSLIALTIYLDAETNIIYIYMAECSRVRAECTIIISITAECRRRSSPSGPWRAAVVRQTALHSLKRGRRNLPDVWMFDVWLTMSLRIAWSR
jgi:hypothetical protein